MPCSLLLVRLSDSVGIWLHFLLRRPERTKEQKEALWDAADEADSAVTVGGEGVQNGSSDEIAKLKEVESDSIAEDEPVKINDGEQVEISEVAHVDGKVFETEEVSVVPVDVESGEPAGVEGDEPVGAGSDEPVGVESDEPVGAESGEPVGAENDEPVGAENDEPVGVESGEPVGAESDEPVGAESDEPVGAESDEPVGAENDEPVGAENDEPVGAENDVDAESDEPVDAESDEPADAEGDKPVTVRTEISQASSSNLISDGHDREAVRDSNDGQVQAASDDLGVRNEELSNINGGKATKVGFDLGDVLDTSATPNPTPRVTDVEVRFPHVDDSTTDAISARQKESSELNVVLTEDALPKGGEDEAPIVTPMADVEDVEKSERFGTECQRTISAIRIAILDAMLAEVLSQENESPSQLVLFAPGRNSRLVERQSLPSPLSVFVVHDAAAVKEYEKEASECRQFLPEGVELIPVEAELDGWAWDSNLVLQGYNWQQESVWVAELDTCAVNDESLERSFRSIGTLAAPGSKVLITYATPEFVAEVPAMCSEWIGPLPSFSCEDPSVFATTCGFQVESNVFLRDAVAKYELPEALHGSVTKLSLADGIGFAILKHAERNVSSFVPATDVLSDVTAYSAFSASASASGAPSVTSGAPPTPVLVGNHFSFGDLEEYLGGNGRTLRFELQLCSLPRHLGRPEYSVVLIGSDVSIGCWDPKRAKRMHGDITASDGFLSIEMLLRIDSCDVEYKYAVTNEQQEIVAWEAGCNRRIGSISESNESARDQTECFRDYWRCE